MNKVMLIGRLTKDPELRYTPGNGTAVATFSLAVDRRTSKDGNKEADFINIVAFGKTAEIISQYITKGRLLAVAGRIQTSSYDGKDGVKRYRTDVVVDDFQFIDSKGSRTEGSQLSEAGYNKPMSRPQSQNYNQNSYEEPGFDNDVTPVDDGDIPF